LTKLALKTCEADGNVIDLAINQSTGRTELLTKAGDRIRRGQKETAALYAVNT